MGSSRPTELQEQIALVRVLRKARLVYCAVPNGGYRLAGEAKRLRASGVVAGVPDLLIFDAPPDSESVGTALELKRTGLKASSVSKAQRAWLEKLEDRGWVSLVAFGCDDAIQQLRGLGYDI